jgi:hypothetical protein
MKALNDHDGRRNTGPRDWVVRNRDGISPCGREGVASIGTENQRVVLVSDRSERRNGECVDVRDGE